MPSVSVVINGKNYRMACDDGQEAHLEMLSKQLDGYVHQLKGSFGDIGDQRLTVMAGIMAVDELHELKQKFSGVEKELTAIKEKHIQEFDAHQSGAGEIAKQIEQIAGQIEVISIKLSQTNS
ncbi:MAG: cell division protein ZapA [Pseudomonadota bacterium]